MQNFCIGSGGLSFDISHINLEISILLLFDMDYRLTLGSRAQAEYVMASVHRELEGVELGLIYFGYYVAVIGIFSKMWLKRGQSNEFEGELVVLII